ncbi:hypothetical protein ACHAXN_004432 [Cyclotella atomus]
MATATAAAAETETEDVADATSQIIIDSGDMKNNPVAPVEENMNTSRRPRDLALLQQRMKAWQPLLSPRWVIAAYLVIAAVFIPVGVVVRKNSDKLIELKSIYESHLKNGPSADVVGCEIGNSPNKMYLNNQETCQIVMKVPDDKGGMDPPVLVHYELFNFYQNFRKYYKSFDQSQLLGSMTQDTVSAEACEPLNRIGDIKINPCGLVANTLFNDVFSLESIVGPDGVVIDASMVETGIAWESDKDWKFRQPEPFRSEQCTSCNACDCDEKDEDGLRVWSCNAPYVDEDGNCHRYFYPEDNTTQYLYETYPMVVSPIDGVTNEHFIVWMRTAALPHFRKLYGYIEKPIPAGSTLTFRVMANFAVERNLGAKAIVVSNTYAFGGKNSWLGNLFIVVGAVAAAFALFFAVKEAIWPRKIADARYLRFKEE